MSGKFIDRAVFTLLGAAALYLFFLNAWGSIPLACCLAFAGCLLVRRLIVKRPVRYKCTSAQAEGELLRIAALSDEEAGSALEALARRRYPHEAFVLAPLTKHPTASVSMGDVFAMWKKHREDEHLLIAATCNADPRAIMYARELKKPQVAVIEKRQLLRIIRTAGLENDNVPRITFFQRLKRIPQRLTLRYTGVKNALFGALLVALYMWMGNPLYLFLGLGSLFLFGCTLPGRRYRRRLF